MQKHTESTIEALASAFRDVLTEWLTPAEFATMRATNAKHAAAGTVGICASHDYCDANVAMEEAFERVVGRESVMPSEGPQGEYDQALWEAAWDRARVAFLTMGA